VSQQVYYSHGGEKNVDAPVLPLMMENEDDDDDDDDDDDLSLSYPPH